MRAVVKKYFLLYQVQIAIYRSIIFFFIVESLMIVLLIVYRSEDAEFKQKLLQADRIEEHPDV